MENDLDGLKLLFLENLNCFLPKDSWISNTPMYKETNTVFKINAWTVDPDQQNLGRSGKLSFFIIYMYKFWQIVLQSGKF